MSEFTGTAAETDLASRIQDPHCIYVVGRCEPVNQWLQAVEFAFQHCLPQRGLKQIADAVRRVFVGGAFDCACDKQGRILIPPTLRQYAGLEKEIVLVGVLDHLEIWSRQNWDSENAHMEDDMQKEDVRNEIAKLGL